MANRTVSAFVVPRQTRRISRRDFWCEAVRYSIDVILVVRGRAFAALGILQKGLPLPLHSPVLSYSLLYVT